jgi:hypothetical protein
MPTHKIYLRSGTGFNTLTRRHVGKGVGTVLLDNGIGGHSSYPGGIDEYLNTVNINKVKGSGVGLDKLNAKLSNLNIKPPDRGCKKKPISFSI